MDIPRALIYKDRQQIEEFGISDNSSPNKKLYEDWIFNVPDLRPGDIGFHACRTFSGYERQGKGYQQNAGEEAYWRALQTP